MTFKFSPRSPEWRPRTITLIALLIGPAGQKRGFEAALAISLPSQFGLPFHTALATQRTVYSSLTVIAYFDPTKLLYIALGIGIVMVVLFRPIFRKRSKL